MDFTLLDKIDAVTDGIVVTVLETTGHTYSKKGAKALFAAGESAPAWGNLGSLCVDQEIIRQGQEAIAEGKPRLLEIDTTEADDINFGYGTYCGGMMRLLLEPLLESHRVTYRKLRERLAANKTAALFHDLDSGTLSLEVDGHPDATRERVFAETIQPPCPLCVFGATPLTRRLVQLLEGMEFNIHVIDWRQAHLDGLMNLECASLHLHLEYYDFSTESFVLVQSHDFRRDKEILKAAFSAGAAWIGMLSSRSRRNKMYEELRAEGVSNELIKRVSSPVGIDIGGKTDGEIAVSIAAELVATRNR